MCSKLVLRYGQCAIVALILACFQSSALARGQYLQWWGEVYPESSSDDAVCQLCHERGGGGNGWNRYGWAIRSAYFPNLMSSGNSESALKDSLQDISGLSDGGSSTFINEINANSQPGWRVGDVNQIRFTDANSTTIAPPATLPCGLLLDEGNQELTCSTTNPIPTDIVKAGPEVEFKAIARGFTAPVTVATAPNQTNFLYVVEQGGLVWKINITTGAKTQYLDFSQKLVSNFGQLFAGSSFEGYDERGLLGFAFHPDFSQNNKVYTYISVDYEAATSHFSTLEIGQDADHMSLVSEWVVVNPGDPSSVATAERELLIVDQPQFNHNGGTLAFGPQGYLYIALGDGGSANDAGPGHGETGNGRDNTNPLGAILRIDVDSPMPTNDRYSVPNDNPFVGESGLDEIYVYGLRNPYRFSIEDDGSGEHQLYIGDVGQDAIEELNRIPLTQAGSHFGWNFKEGTFYFSVINGSTFVSPVPPNGVTTPPLVDPVAEYDHNEGLSIIAGHVYQGNSIPGLRGRYVFGDWGRSFASPDGRLFFLNASSQLRELNTAKPVGLHVTGFGKDSAGELYVVGTKGFRVSDQGMGALYKLVAPSELCLPIKTKSGRVATICL